MDNSVHVLSAGHTAEVVAEVVSLGVLGTLAVALLSTSVLFVRAVQRTMQAELATISARFDAVDHRFDAVERVMDERFAGVEKRLDLLDRDVQTLTGRFRERGG